MKTKMQDIIDKDREWHFLKQGGSLGPEFARVPEEELRQMLSSLRSVYSGLFELVRDGVISDGRAREIAGLTAREWRAVYALIVKGRA